MLHSIKLNATVFIMALFTSSFLLAQQSGQHKDCSSFNSSRSITLDVSSKSESIKMQVDKDTKNLLISVNSTISSGELTMEILDPKGNEHGSFSVESQMTSNSASQGKSKDEVCGQLNKSFSKPMAGQWIVKLKPKNVTGKIQVNSNQIQ